MCYKNVFALKLPFRLGAGFWNESPNNPQFLSFASQNSLGEQSNYIILWYDWTGRCAAAARCCVYPVHRIREEIVQAASPLIPECTQQDVVHQSQLFTLAIPSAVLLYLLPWTMCVLDRILWHLCGLVGFIAERITLVSCFLGWFFSPQRMQISYHTILAIWCYLVTNCLY